MNSEKKITASQARDKFIKAWDKCEFGGVKEKVKKAHTSRTIQYILETKTYSKTHVILEIIETLKTEVEAFKKQAVNMNDDVLESLKS